LTLSRRDLLKRSAQVGLGLAVVGNTNLFTAIAAGAATGGAKGPARSSTTRPACSTYPRVSTTT
jgi:anaerobic selenocysteine-containing dehydrogenase